MSHVMDESFMEEGIGGTWPDAEHRIASPGQHQISMGTSRARRVCKRGSCANLGGMCGGGAEGAAQKQKRKTEIERSSDQEIVNLGRIVCGGGTEEEYRDREIERSRDREERMKRESEERESEERESEERESEGGKER